MQIGLIDTAICLHHLPQANGNVRVEFTSGHFAAQSKTSNKPSHGNTSLEILLKGLTVTQAAIPAIVCIDLQREPNVFFNVLQALDRLIEKDVRVICLPIGVNAASPFFDLAMRACVQKNILIIAPSGNLGNGKVLAPAIYDEVLSVGAVDEYGQTPAFSGRIFDENGYCLKPDIAALGVHVGISSNNEQIIKKSGTSIACATVSGIAAAMLQANPSASAHDIHMALIESCTPAYGSRFGIVGAQKAIECIQTKAPYKQKRSFSETPKPTQTYIDPRLKSQCKQATRNNKSVESLVVSNVTINLMERFANKFSKEDFQFTLFKNFEMAHVTATPSFYEALFTQPDIQVCSAVDINYFDI
jgi:hypothetical protein